MTSSYAIPAQLDYIVYSNKANSLFYSLIVSLHPLTVLQIESYVLLSLTKKFKTNFKFVMPSEELFTIKIHIYKTTEPLVLAQEAGNLQFES